MDHVGDEARRFSDDAEWMGALIVELRRALRRANARTHDSPAPTRRSLTHSQQEVLRFVAAHPGIGTNDIAAALMLSSNTVSSLVSRLVSAGDLRREIDSEDRRKARFFLSEEHDRSRTANTDRRAATVSAAMRDMDAQARQRLHEALPALAELVACLDSIDTEPADPSRSGHTPKDGCLDG